MLDEVKILFRHGRQYIPDIEAASLTAPFRGRPVLTATDPETARLLSENCPAGALTAMPFSIDIGKCLFCGDCARRCPEVIRFSADHRMATNDRAALIIAAGADETVSLQPDLVRDEIHHLFGRSLKLRQVSAGGDNSAELELNACSNPNFDMGRYGIEFVASPRHADGLVITGPISRNMARALQICYEAVPEPRIIVLASTDAISGGLYAGSPALDRSFLDKYPVDLYVPGQPPHPLTFIQGILDLIRKKSIQSI